MSLKKFSELSEARGDTAVFCIGRFNPPTTGHELMIDSAANIQSKYPGAKFYVFPTHSQDPQKNPLPHALKVAYMKKMFKKYARNIQVSKARNVFEMATLLHDKGHRAIVLVAGSDRVDEFDKLLNQYNGVKGKHGYYGFDSIEVISAGERDPDAEGVSGMSASKMRAAASQGDYDSFKQGLPTSFKDGVKLYNDVRKHMGIREERDMGKMNDYEALRDAYLTGKIWNINDLVEANGIEGRVVNRGTNYIGYMDGSGKVHKAWLHDIALNERNYAKEYQNYHSRPEQIANRSSRNKARRVMGDKVVKGMDVGHADNNPLNNDPDNLRNEDPSTNRREPRLREAEDHRKDYETFAKMYAKLNKAVDDASEELKKFKGKGPMGLTPDKVKISPKFKKAKADYEKASNLTKRFLKGVPKDFLKKYSQSRRLRREEVELDEMAWFKKLKSKIDQMRHPKAYDNLIKQYVQDVSDKVGTQVRDAGSIKVNNPAGIATDIANEVGINPREFVEYINILVKKGVLPKELKAEYKTESITFKDLVNQINEVKQDKEIKSREGSQPAKYYAKDTEGDEMAPSTKQKRAAHFAKKKKGPAPGDKSATTKSSTHTNKFKQMYGEALPKNADQGDYIDDFQKSDAPQFKGKSKEKRKDMAIAAYLSKNEAYQLDEKIEGLVKKAEKSGMPYSVLKKVYDRGMAAWKTGHRPGTTPQQWAMARVNSFTTKSSGTWGKADKDLAKQVEQVEESELNEWGEITEKDDKSGKELNNPTKGDVKKYKVYVKNKKGNVVKVEFGDPNMSIQRDDPEARKNFRARHNCDQKKDKTTAGYWSCKFWSTKSVSDLMKG
jgi:hypothetical protein